MARIPGVEIEELYAKYELHPILLDLYVEGEFDRDLINYFLDQRGHSSYVSVFTVDQVEVPDEILVDKSLQTGSNKSRLIALASMLSEKFKSIDTNVSCIVDTDHDVLLDQVVNMNNLLYTDYSCMEMYCLNEATLKKFLILGCNLKPSHLDELNSILNAVLPVQFCLRGVNHSLGLNSTFPPVKKGVGKKRGLAYFQESIYVDAFIQLNNLHRRSEEIKEELKKLFSKVPVDIRQKSNGHDFVCCVFDYADESGGVKLHSKNEDVEIFGGRLLANALDTSLLFAENLFSRIEAAAVGRGPLWGRQAQMS